MIDPDAVVEARRALGRQLATYRRTSGLSQHRLAERLHYGRSTIANVETGRQNVGREFWQQCDQETRAGGVLIRAYDAVRAMTTQEQRDLVTQPAGALPTVPGRSPETDVEMVDRRTVTQLMGGMLAGAALPGFDLLMVPGEQQPRTVADPAVLAGHLAVTDRLAGMYRAADPLPVLPMAAAYADRLLHDLDRGVGSADVVATLVALVVGVHAQVGLWACHSDQPGLARRYLAVACEVAADADEPALHARALGAMSYLYSSAPRGGRGGNPRRALALLDAALARATMADSFTRGWLATWRADQHATLGNLDQARRDVAFAHTALAARDDEDPCGFFSRGHYGYGMRGHLASVHATVEALAGNSTGAERAFADVHASAANMRRRIATLGHQAFTYVAAAEPEAASTVLARSVNLAVTERYGMGLRRAVGVRAGFDPAWATLPAVRHLDEHLALATAG